MCARSPGGVLTGGIGVLKHAVWEEEAEELGQIL